MSDIFRKKSLEKLSSPDQLDTLMKVTNTRGWLALLALGGLVVLAVVWSIMSTIPEKVAGQGLFLRPDGLLEISAPSTGRVKDIYVKTGDIIKKGYPIARIEQKDLLEEIKLLRKTLSDLEEKFEKQSATNKQESSMEEDISLDKRKALGEKVKDLEKQEIWLSEKWENQKELLSEGLIVKQTLLDTESALASVQRQILEAENERNQVTLSLLKTFSQDDMELGDLLDEIVRQERDLEQKSRELETASKVVSPYTCRIVELNTSKDTMVQNGSTIAKIELIDNSIKSLEAVLYFPAADGNKIKQGMKVTLSPSTVKQEEYGFILGLVTYVSEFPASPSSMENVLHNETLVQTFSIGSAPIEVRADLIPDPHTYSEYKWSSGKGPNIKIDTGTLCSGTVVVKESMPISLVIPLLKKYAMGY